MIRWALGILPLLACISVVFLIANVRPRWGWRRSFIRGLILAGAYMVVGTEALSLVHAIRLVPLVVFWSLPTVLAMWFVWRAGAQGRPVLWPNVRLPSSWWSRGEITMVAVVFLLTALVAWFAPPQTWDSLTYHMARVAHWAQNGSIAHYATGIERQNLMSPGAEIGMLHLYVLAGSDQLVNFVQWFAMVGSVVGVAILAGQFGASVPGQIFAGVFVATLPMGISEATSTMTDYAVSLWLVCVASEMIAYLKGNGSKATYIFLGLGVGLVALTKPTGFPYLLPFAVIIAIAGFKRHGLRHLAAGTLVVVAAVAIVNLGYVGRNLETYGGPMGPTSKVSATSNEIINMKVVVSNLLRNASLQAGTPWEGLNRQLFRAIVGIHFKIGIDPNDPRTSAHPDFQVFRPSQDETRSGNLLQAVLALITIVGLSAYGAWHWRRTRGVALYVLALVLGFVVFSALYKFTPFGSRYELPFFVLTAPAVAWLMDQFRWPLATSLVALALLVYAWPWLVSLNQRPLLPKEAGKSIATQPRDDFYFAIAPSLQAPYQSIADAIGADSCHSVGLMLGGDAAEYPLWAYLGEPNSPIRIEWIVAGTPSARYRDPSFSPCAVVCDISCPGNWTTVSGLPLAMNESGMRLYLK